MSKLAYVRPEKNLGYQLWLVSNRWQRTLRKELEPLGLTHVQYLILAVTQFLLESEPCVTQVSVARTADTDEMMTSQVVRHLEERGLLKRLPHPTDARARCLTLTEKGIEVTSQARTRVRSSSDKFFSVLGEQGEQLTALLHNIAEHNKSDAHPAF